MPTKDELFQMRSLPLHLKVQKTKARIREWYEHFDGDVYVSFSGGKDSTVLRDIVKDVYKDVPSVFCDTGLEWPGVRENGLTADVILHPKKNFKQVIEEYGYPVISKETALCIYYARKQCGKTYIRALKKLNDNKSPYGCSKWKFLLDAPFEISHRCCDIMKKLPFKKYERESGRKKIVGSTTSESKLRFQKWLQHGCNAFDGTAQTSMPLAFWTENDILQYIVEHKLNIPKEYGEIVKTGENYSCTGLKRTGCMFCCFGVHLEKEPNRFQIMKQMQPKLYEYCMNKLKLDEVLNYINVNH